MVHAREIQPALPVLASAARHRAVIIDGGPAGMRDAAEPARRGLAVTVLGEEAERPCNRLRLPPLFGGEARFGDIALPEAPAGDAPVAIQAGRRGVGIDRARQAVITADGAVCAPVRLVLATGAQAHVPASPAAICPASSPSASPPTPRGCWPRALPPSASACAPGPPARGGNDNLAGGEVAAAVAFLVWTSGGAVEGETDARTCMTEKDK